MKSCITMKSAITDNDWTPYRNQLAQLRLDRKGGQMEMPKPAIVSCTTPITQQYLQKRPLFPAVTSDFQTPALL
jgi:hypothetical protein